MSSSEHASLTSMSRVFPASGETVLVSTEFLPCVTDEGVATGASNFDDVIAEGVATVVVGEVTIEGVTATNMTTRGVSVEIVAIECVLHHLILEGQMMAQTLIALKFV